MGKRVPHIKRIIERDGPGCHYCKGRVRVGRDHAENMRLGDKLATKDHIVPKSMGGPGVTENFVLACKGCNEKRGDNLYYCACAFCVATVAAFMERHFGGTFGPVKPRVWKHHDGRWITSYGLNSYGWDNWKSAMRAVPSAERVNA